MKYTVTIVERLYYDIEVEADSQADAGDLAWDEFRDTSRKPSDYDSEVVGVIKTGELQ